MVSGGCSGNAGYRVLDDPVRLAVASGTQAWYSGGCSGYSRVQTFGAQISVEKLKSYSDIYCHCGPSLSAILVLFFAGWLVGGPRSLLRLLYFRQSSTHSPMYPCVARDRWQPIAFLMAPGVPFKQSWRHPFKGEKNFILAA